MKKEDEKKWKSCSFHSNFVQQAKVSSCCLHLWLSMCVCVYFTHIYGPRRPPWCCHRHKRTDKVNKKKKREENFLRGA